MEYMRLVDRFVELVGDVEAGNVWEDIWMEMDDAEAIDWEDREFIEWYLR